MSLIKLMNVNKIYGVGDKRVQALKNINLKINKGELIAVVGTSGSGKSTLLNVLGFLDDLTDGEYRLNDNNVSDLTFNKKAKLRNTSIGFVVQNFALISDYTVEENIEIPLEYAKVKKKQRKEIIKNICTELGIENKINTYITELSGGQCQRVAIGRALSNNPEIILADEPTGALDSKTSQEVMNIFKNLNEKGKTIIIVTHDNKIAEQCKRKIYIEDGVIVSDITK